MWTIISTIITLICLVIILYVASRKFPALAILDVENIQAEKEARFKEEIISNRIKRNMYRSLSRLGVFLLFVWKKLSLLAKKMYENIVEMKNSYKNEEILDEDARVKKVKELNEEASEFIYDDNFTDAEKKLIEIIGLDSRNAEAFERLGDIYVEMKNHQDAVQTYQHTLRLIDPEKISKIAELNHSIAIASKLDNDMDVAMRSISRSLEIEPNNPRYLDFMLNLSIIIMDKSKALETYDKLATVNPENKKLSEIKEKIQAL